MDEGSKLVMTELVLEEKRLRAKIALLDKQLEEPEAKLAKAKAILLKAKAHFEQCLEAVKPLRSDKILLEGELEILEAKKAELRVESRLMAGGGLRPGTQQLVEQMSERVGASPEELAVKKAARELEADQALEALKAKMDSED